jgi:hypothetical protein
VRPEERTARVKGWRMDCMLAIWLRRHTGARRRGVVGGRGVVGISRGDLFRGCEVAARK